MLRYRPVPQLSYFLFAVLLSACSSLNKIPELKNPDWDLSAKIAVRPHDGNNQSAIVNWQKKGSQSIIRCYNSFSQPLFNLIIDSDKARMDTADGRTKEAGSAEALMQETLGWFIPTDVMTFWLKGQTGGNETNITHKSGQLDSFHYQQWQVTLSRYKRIGNRMQPMKIQLENSQFTLLILIKQYEQHH